MPYPSILTVWDGVDATRTAFQSAMNLAEDWASHLDVACIGVDQAPTGFYASELAHELSHDFYQEARSDAANRTSEARHMLNQPDLAWSVRSAAVRYAELPVVIGKAAWFQDLVIMPKPFGREDADLAEAMLDAALFNAPAPTLVIADEIVQKIGKNIMVAWNDSPEAAHALRAAMPLLEAAEEVEAVMVEPGPRGGGGADPSTALGAMLSRHGVNAAISQLPQTGETVADTLRTHALETGADMIVMGAYGHSRFRERMLGGATRDMLKSADIPVFFAR